jgi:hypothetical protein
MRGIRPGVLVLAVAVLAGAIAIVIGPGWSGLLVYGFFVGLATLVSLGMGVAGGVVTGASRGRFRRHDRS